MIRLGDKIRARPTLEAGSAGKTFEGTEMTGTVVYIHPNHRFYTLEFQGVNGFRWRECYFYPRSGVYEPSRAKPCGRHIKI